MINNIVEVGLLTDEDLGIEPPKKDELPGSTKEKEIVETPEQKLEKEKTVKEVQDKLSKNPIELGELTDEEVEEAPLEKPKKLTQKDFEAAIDYKALVSAKIENGDWEKWDNWDEVKDSVDYTPELYLQLEKEQFESKVQKTLQEEKSALPKRVQEITEYIKNGGKEEDLYASYQQENDIQSLNPAEPDEAEAIIAAHCEATGWSEKRTKAYIEGLKDRGDDELKSTAEESKEALVKVVQEEREEIQKQQKAISEQNRIYWETFNKKVRTAIYKEESTPDREKKELEKFIWDYKYEDKTTGQKYSEFGKKFDEIRNDPDKYYKFLRFIKDFEKFEDKGKTEKEVKGNVLNFLRSGQKELGKNTGTQSPDIHKDKKNGRGQYNPFASLTGA